VSSKAQKTEPNSSACSSTTTTDTKQGSQVHHGVQCDSCGICPIRGALFSSQVASSDFAPCRKAAVWHRFIEVHSSVCLWKIRQLYDIMQLKDWVCERLQG
jgi:hypothetical protein